MMSPDSTDLSPRMSIQDIGDSLSSSSPSFGFDRSRGMGGMGDVHTRDAISTGLVGPASPINAMENTTSSTTTTTTTTTAPTTVLAIREEDLLLLSDTLEQALDSADKTLQGLETDRELLPSAILRKCHEFADGLGSLADELEGQSLEERRTLVGAIRDDLRLFDEDFETVHGSDPHRDVRGLSSFPAASANGHKTNGELPSKKQTNTINTIDDTDDDIVQALSGASNLLRDVESAFREIGNDEAEEIADAALIMARLFLLSMQNIHSNLLGQLGIQGNNPNNDFKRNQYDRTGSNRDRGRSSVWIEELSSSDDVDDSDNVDQKEPSPSDKKQRKNKLRGRSIHQRRVRVLWPPLGPRVDIAMTWTKEEATKRPFLAVALGLTLWPVAISTALLGTSLSLIDGALQDTYDRFREGPWISVAEESAAQAYQTSRLTVATGKLVGRQGLRVAARQIERRGGLLPIVRDLGCMALDRIAHPIDTIGSLWDGIHWGFGVAKDATDDFLSMRLESQETLM